MVRYMDAAKAEAMKAAREFERKGVAVDRDELESRSLDLLIRKVVELTDPQEIKRRLGQAIKFCGRNLTKELTRRGSGEPVEWTNCPDSLVPPVEARPSVEEYLALECHSVPHRRLLVKVLVECQGQPNRLPRRERNLWYNEVRPLLRGWFRRRGEGA